MSNLKRFTLIDTWKDWEVVIEADLDILTNELAKEINEFWSGHQHRASEAPDLVHAVVKMAAERWIGLLLEGGCNSVSTELQARSWTKDLHEMEGWGGWHEDKPYGLSGIRLISADVDADPDLQFKEDV